MKKIKLTEEIWKEGNMYVSFNSFKILLVFVIILTLSCSNVSSQSIGGNNPYDSLLFDGSGSIFLRDANEKCKVTALGVVGKVIGTFYKDSIGSVCGVKDTIRVTRTGQLHNGYKLVPGTEVTTGPYDDVTNETYNIVQLVTANSSEHISLGSQTFLGKVVIGKDCTFHVKSGNVEVHGEVDISTSRSKITHKHTQYTLEVIQDGDKFTDVVKVYEGSVELAPNNEDPDYKKNSKQRDDALKEETKKLTEEYQSGKLTADEFKQRFEEIQKKLKASTDMIKTVTIDAGYTSSITDGDPPTDPVPFDVNENRWWERK